MGLHAFGGVRVGGWIHWVEFVILICFSSLRISGWIRLTSVAFFPSSITTTFVTSVSFSSQITITSGSTSKRKLFYYIRNEIFFTTFNNYYFKQLLPQLAEISSCLILTRSRIGHFGFWIIGIQPTDFHCCNVPIIPCFVLAIPGLQFCLSNGN